MSASAHIDGDDAADLVPIAEFMHLVAQHAQSPRQRERVARAARVPVTGAGLAALRVVQRHGPIASSAVARRMGIDESTWSRQLKPLEEERLVRRRSDDADRRVAWLEITPKGAALLARADSVLLNDFAVALSDWSGRDRRVLAELLDRFRADLLRTRTDAQGWSVDKA